jgi:hypothetical protein
MTTPFCTVQIGVNKLLAGDTLTITDGVYSTGKILVKTSGTVDKPIVIQGQGRETVLDAQGKSWSEYGILHVQGRSFITIKNLSLINSPWYGMQVSGSKFVTVDNVFSSHHRMSGFVFDQLSSDLVLSNSEVTDVGLCETLKVSCAHEAVTFSNVTRFKAFGNYVHDSGREGMDAKDGATDGEFYDNHVHHMSQVGMYLNHALRVKFYRNNVHHNKQDGFMLGVGDWAEQINSTSDNQIYQNQTWANGACGIVFWRSNSTGPIKNNLIYNNVIWRNKYEGVDNQNLPAAQFSGNVFRNNIIGLNGTDKPGASMITGNVWDHNLWVFGSVYPGSFNIVGEPLFVAPLDGDFRLQAGSPAIDRGISMGLPFSGSAPDMGRFEFGWTPQMDAVVRRDSTVQPVVDAAVKVDAKVCMCPCPCFGVMATQPPASGPSEIKSQPPVVPDWRGGFDTCPKLLLIVLGCICFFLGAVSGMIWSDRKRD